MPLSHSGNAGQPAASNLCTTPPTAALRSGWGLCKSLCASLSLGMATTMKT